MPAWCFNATRTEIDRPQKTVNKALHQESFIVFVIEFFCLKASSSLITLIYANPSKFASLR